MKKIYFILLLVVAVFAIALADNTDKVLRIYHGGNITNIPLSEIEKISHSKYDADNVLNSENVTSVFQTINDTYNIPINSIESVEIVSENTNEYYETIYSYILAQEEQDVSKFQTGLLSWLNNQNWIVQTKLNERKDNITITIESGEEFFVNFQSLSLLDDVEDITRSSVAQETTGEPISYYDVSSQNDEKIIDNLNVLDIQCMNMILSSASSEEKSIRNHINNSPVNFIFEVSPYTMGLKVFDYDFSKYGMIIISQTHGYLGWKDNKEMKGLFQLEDKLAYNPMFNTFLPNRGFVIYIDNRGYIIKNEKRKSFVISPELVANKLKGNNDAIIYGNYCWSYGLADYIKGNTVFGYQGESHLFYNKKALVKFMEEMSSGATVYDANDRVIGAEFFKYGYDNQPTLSKNSKQRYFSIKTNDLKYEDGEVIVSGQIKGYKNLKPEFNTGIIYEHQGAEAFTPKDQCEIYYVDINEEDGTFEAKIPTYWREYNTEYGYMFGFDKYYGETKTIPLYSLTTYPVYDSDIEGTTVTVNGKLYGDLSRNGSVGFYYAEVVGTPVDPVESERKYITVANSLSGLQDGEFSYKLTGLNPNAQYVFNTFAIVEESWFFGDPLPFQTKMDVETGDYTLDKDDPTKATLFGSIPKYSPLDMDGQDVEVGFVYDKYPSLNFYNDNRIRVYPIGNANFSGLAEDLEESTTYYYRAYLKMGDFINYGEEKSFTTEQWLKIQTLDATNRTTNAATLNGQIQHLDKVSGRYELRFYYGTKNNLSISTAKYVVVPNNQQNDGVFSVTINNLNPKTDYYFAAAIKIRGEVMLGNVMKIQSPKEYTVQTVGSNNVKTTSATLLGQVDGFQKADVSGSLGEVGFLISTLSTLAIDNSNATCIKVANLQDLNTGSFSTVVKQLQSNTVYYYRAYVTGNGYVNYGEIKTLTTSIEVNIATVSATDVTSSSAQLNGSLEGLESLKDHYQIGFYYGNSADLDPSSAQFVTMTQQSGNNFSAVIDNLKPETDYYFKAAIKINDDIQCGDVKMLHTLQKDMVVTVGSRDVEATSATLIGQVKNFHQESFANIQGEIGFVIGTSSSLSVNSLSNTQIKVSNIEDLTSGDFTADMNELQEQTTYYYAAYIIADNKVSYGEVKNFKTPRLLDVITLGAGNIKASSAQILGKAINLSSISGTYNLGFYYSTDSNPGATNGVYVQSEYTDTDGSFYASLSGLEGDTKYYYIAVIQVGGETIFSETIRSFQTEEARPGVAAPVDLGLSVKWASWNMGATAPEELGGMYAIGELQPKEEFSWENYQVSTDIKGCFSATQYDAAYNTWGKDWRLPTNNEILELVQKCSGVYTEQNGVPGILLTGSTGNSIFYQIQSSPIMVVIYLVTASLSRLKLYTSIVV